jgi:outer membrane protein
MALLRLFFIIVVISLPISVTAKSLVQVYALALESDPQLLAEAASQRAISELKNQAKANFLPDVSATADNGRVWRDSSAQTFGGDQNYNSHGYTLTLTQPLFRRENSVIYEQADIAIASATASFEAQQQNLMMRVAEGYFTVLAAQDDVSFTMAELEALALQLEQTQQRFDVGVATITDVVESQAAYDLANAGVIEANNALINAKERLQEVAGVYVDRLSTLKTESPLVKPEPLNVEQWTNKALSQNLTLKVARKDVETAQQEIELKKSGHYPSLDLVGQKQYDSQSESNFGGGSKTHQETVGIQISIPIYQGGTVSSQTREASHRLEQAMQQEEQQRRAVVRQTREAYNSVLSGISRVKALKQATVSGEKALESTEAGFEVGTRTTVDVVNVRRDLFSARRDYAQARYTYILNSLRLKQAVGILAVSDLDLINQWLEDE